MLESVDGINFDNSKQIRYTYMVELLIYNFNRFLCIKGDFDIASKGFEMSNFSVGINGT
jgi:hypothetical protein